MEEILFTELKKKARQNCIPIGGQFELTPQCTLDCKMCYVHLTKKQMEDRLELSADEWIHIIDQAHENGLLFSLLTGGECTLHPGFCRIYEHLQSLGVFVTVNTNGFLISEEIFSLFQKTPPRAVNITLYGSSNDVYENVTGVRAFEKVSANILRLRDMGINVSVSITVSKYLLDDVLNILTFCKENHLPYNLSYSLIEAREGTERAIEDYGLSVDEEIELRLCVNKFLKKKIYDNPCVIAPPSRCESGQTCYGIDCNAGKGSFVVTWDGLMHPCFRTTEISCSLLEHGFKETWESVSTATKNIIVPVECERCSFRKACNSCFIMRADSSDSCHCDNEMCRRTIEKIRAGIVKFPK